jgi:hypothetical protein
MQHVDQRARDLIAAATRDVAAREHRPGPGGRDGRKSALRFAADAGA